jgi:cytochrome c
MGILASSVRCPERGRTMNAGRALMLIVIATAGCQKSAWPTNQSVESSNPERGKSAIGRYGCPSCHTIPGVRGAVGLVGPSLDRIASRTYIAGVLQNTHSNMLRWIQNPPKVDDKTAMPNLRVTDQDAQDIASFLYTLR